MNGLEAILEKLWMRARMRACEEVRALSGVGGVGGPQAGEGVR